MSALQGPPRWLSADHDVHGVHDVNQVAAQLRPALRMARGEGPSATEHERMWGSLAAKLPGAVVSGAGPETAGAAAASGGAGSALVQSASAGVWRIVGTGIVAAALGFGVAKLTTSSSTPSGPGEGSRVAAEQQSFGPADGARPQPTQPLLAPSLTTPTPSLAVGVPEPLPAIDSAATGGQQRPTQSAAIGESAEPALRTGARSSNTPRGDAANAHASRENTSRVGASTAIASRVGALGANATRARLQGPAPSQPRPAKLDPISAFPDLAAELDLLARARRVVAGSPARALQLAAEHARRFSNGVLAQEREVLAIDALTRLGQHELAAMRARRFIERYPDSAHRVRLDLALQAQ